MSQVVSQTPSIDYGETPAPVQAVLDIYKANMAHLPTDRDFRIRVAECLQNMRSYWTQPCAPGQTLYAHSKAKLGLGNVDINPKTFGLVADKRISELHEAVKLMRLLGHRRSNVDSSSDSSVSSAPRHLSPDEQKEHYRKQELKVSQVFTCCNHAITVVQCELTQHFIHNEAGYESTPESELPWGVIEQRNRYLFSHLFDDSKITDQQQMIMYVYGELMRRGYRKLGGDCYCEIMVKKSDINVVTTTEQAQLQLSSSSREEQPPEGGEAEEGEERVEQMVHTHAWEPACSIEEFVYMVTSRDASPDMWAAATKSSNAVAHCVGQLEKGVDTDFPQLFPERELFSFRNGQYCVRCRTQPPRPTPTCLTAPPSTPQDKHFL